MESTTGTECRSIDETEAAQPSSAKEKEPFLDPLQHRIVEEAIESAARFVCDVVAASRGPDVAGGTRARKRAAARQRMQRRGRAGVLS